MLNFIVCDDDQFFRQGMKKQIEAVRIQVIQNDTN